jgi:branched-subunit amino acid permease
MTTFLILAGVVSFIYGALNILGLTKNDASKDSEMDKRLMSKKTRYFMGRYYAGIQFMGAGLGAILLGLILK